MREPADLRRQRILTAVEARWSARVTDLAAELQVSVVTVRRDAEEPAREGRLRRGHGVVRSTLPAQEFPARGLPGGEPGPADPPDGNAVAVTVPERHSYLYEALHGARSVLEAAGRRIALHIAPHGAGAERPLAERALADGATGLLPAPRWRTRADEEADQDWPAVLGVPTVLMERRPRPGSALHAMDSVCSDHEYGARPAVEHLVGLSFRQIVFATREDSPTVRTLRSAFARIAEEHPLVEAAAWTPSAPDAGPGGPYPVGEPGDLYARLRAPAATAAVLHGDVDALMLVHQPADNGVRVLEDCSVVTYDDVVAGLGTTPLTAVAPPEAELGRVAAELLLRRLDAPSGASVPAVRRVELLPTLTVRGSTRALTANTDRPQGRTGARAASAHDLQGQGRGAQVPFDERLTVPSSSDRSIDRLSVGR